MLPLDPSPATMYGMVRSDAYRSLSFWHDTVPGTLAPGDPLPGDAQADVAIVGAGFTGLWTAYYLARRDPSLRIVVCERDIAGFGASGRNGGWCSALFPASLAKLTRMASRDAAVAMQRAMYATVDEVGAVAAAEGIDCHWAKGGTVMLARSPAQLERAKSSLALATRTSACSVRPRPVSWLVRPAYSAARTRRIAPLSIRRGWRAACLRWFGGRASACTSGRRC
jgi:glycine/D-amino acid oxidase-like deaminating enzyme